jgi:hypothetical protein
MREDAEDPDVTPGPRIARPRGFIRFTPARLGARLAVALRRRAMKRGATLSVPQRQAYDGMFIQQ